MPCATRKRKKKSDCIKIHVIVCTVLLLLTSIFEGQNSISDSGNRHTEWLGEVRWRGTGPDASLAGFRCEDSEGESA